MITLDQAKNLKRGDILHFESPKHCQPVPDGPRGGKREAKIEKYRVSGQVKTWKRSPSRVYVPLKFGIYEYAVLTEDTLQYFHLESECPLTADQTSATVGSSAPKGWEVAETDPYADSIIDALVAETLNPEVAQEIAQMEQD